MTREIITRANVVAVAAVTALIALVGALNWVQTSQTQQARAWAKHTTDVIGAVKDLGLYVRDAETGQRGYLLTGDADYLPPYEVALDRAGFLEGELQRLTADNPAQQARLRDLAPVMQRKFEELGQTIQLRRDGMADAALRLVKTDVGRQLMLDLEARLSGIEAAEQVLLAERVDEVNRGIVRVRWTSMAGAVVAGLAMLWAGRMLSQAWRRSHRAELAQRGLAMQLRVSLDSLSQGVAVFSAAKRLRHWNACFQILLDLPAAMLREEMPYAAFADHSAQCGVALEGDALVGDGRSAQGDVVVYTREKPATEKSAAHHLEIRRATMPDGGFVLTISDMTKRAQAEAVLREAQKMQAVGQLTGGIAHDFNNLLTVILGNLEFAAARLAGHEAVLTRIGRAVWAAQRGATLTSHLLSFARKQPLAPTPIDLLAGLTDLMPLLRRTLGEHIDIRVVDGAGVWPALADLAQLENAVLNLALNARDAMPGGGRLTIEIANKVLDHDYAQAHAEVAGGDYVMLAVSDTGHGMTQAVMGRVFEPFFTTKPEGKGTGLGLAMVFGFVKQSGGHVKIYSEPGEGTSIKIYLPRAVGAVTGSPRLVAETEVSRGSAVVLVVEDELEVREIAVAILRDLGYRVLQAADGTEALLVFGANASEIDLLLTDVVLPGTMRGRDVAERVTAMRPAVKVLYMSGYTENAIVHHGRLDDGVHLIGKPFKREQLGRKVAEVLGQHADGGKVVDIKSRQREQ